MMIPKEQHCWGAYNYSNLIFTRRTRSQAIAEVEKHTGEKWRKAKQWIQVMKVIVKPNVKLTGSR